MTDSFSGILPESVPAFIFAQLIGAAAAFGLLSWLLAETELSEPESPTLLER